MFALRSFTPLWVSFVWAFNFLWWNINEKYIKFSQLHSVFFPCNRTYMLILMGVLTLYQVWLWKLYLILANIALVITTSMSFLSPGFFQTFMFLCLNCYVDKEDNLMFYANSYGSIDLISGKVLKTLFDPGKHSIDHKNKH